MLHKFDETHERLIIFGKLIDYFVGDLVGNVGGNGQIQFA